MKDNLLANFPTFDQIAGDLNNELLGDLTTYYEESRFGLELIIDDLKEFKDNTRILEIGSGIGLLSQYLASMGFEVTAIEPTGQGFGMMSNLQEHVRTYFNSAKSNLKFHDSTLEDFSPGAQYDYIFSINVFEHITNPMQGLKKTFSLLGKGGVARIVTPNYGIPYEPHFHIPILFSKKFTYLVFRSRIKTFNCFDPIGLWESLNWISIGKVKKILNLEAIDGTFSQRATYLYFERLSGESQFLARKGVAFKFVAQRLRFLLKFLPLWLFPILDLTLGKSHKPINRNGEANV